MSKTLDELKQEAVEGVEGFRGHELGAWSDGRRHSAADCLVCGMGVSVTPDPLPNEIDIGGRACGMHCPGVTACPECGEALWLLRADVVPTGVGRTPWDPKRDGGEFLVLGDCKHCMATIEVGVSLTDRPIVVPF